MSEAPWEGAEEMIAGGSEAIRCWVTVNGKDAKATIDTGATTNVMGESLFNQLCPQVPIRTPTSRLYALGQVKPLKVKGVAEVDIGYDDKLTRSLVHITSQVTGFILSKAASIHLGLIAVLCQPEDKHAAAGGQEKEIHEGGNPKDTVELDNRESTRDTVIGASQVGGEMGAEPGGSLETEQRAKRRRKRRRTKWSQREVKWSPGGKEYKGGFKEIAQEAVRRKQVKRRGPCARKRRASTPGSQGSEFEGIPRARRQRQATGRPGGVIELDAEGRDAQGTERSEKKGEQPGAGRKGRCSGRSRREEKEWRGVGMVKDNNG